MSDERLTQIKDSINFQKMITESKGFDMDLLQEEIDLYDEIIRLKEQLDFLKLDNPSQNIEHFRIVNENKRKINDLRYQNKQLKEQLQRRDNVIKEAIKKCELEIRASAYQYNKSHKQQDWVYKVAHERVLDILNKYKKEESE